MWMHKGEQFKGIPVIMKSYAAERVMKKLTYF